MIYPGCCSPFNLDCISHYILIISIQYPAFLIHLICKFTPAAFNLFLGECTWVQFPFLYKILFFVHNWFQVPQLRFFSCGSSYFSTSGYSRNTSMIFSNISSSCYSKSITNRRPIEFTSPLNIKKCLRHFNSPSPHSWGVRGFFFSHFPS